jgi:hypothetical protein
MCGQQGGARIVKQEEFINLPFKGNSGISRVELPALIPVTGALGLTVKHCRDVSG